VQLRAAEAATLAVCCCVVPPRRKDQGGVVYLEQSTLPDVDLGALCGVLFRISSLARL
jgi:hypothetical protein